MDSINPIFIQNIFIGGEYLTIDDQIIIADQNTESLYHRNCTQFSRP